MQIASAIKGRSPLDIKNRYYSLEEKNRMSKRIQCALSGLTMLSGVPFQTETDVHLSELASHTNKSASSIQHSVSINDRRSMDFPASSIKKLKSNHIDMSFSGDDESSNKANEEHTRFVNACNSSVATTLTTSDGIVLKQVPDHPYLYYDENHAMVHQLFDQISSWQNQQSLQPEPPTLDNGASSGKEFSVSSESMFSSGGYCQDLDYDFDLFEA